MPDSDAIKAARLKIAGDIAVEYLRSTNHVIPEETRERILAGSADADGNVSYEEYEMFCVYATEIIDSTYHFLMGIALG